MYRKLHTWMSLILFKNVSVKILNMITTYKVEVSKCPGRDRLLLSDMQDGRFLAVVPRGYLFEGHVTDLDFVYADDGSGHLREILQGNHRVWPEKVPREI